MPEARSHRAGVEDKKADVKKPGRDRSLQRHCEIRGDIDNNPEMARRCESRGYR